MRRDGVAAAAAHAHHLDAGPAGLLVGEGDAARPVVRDSAIGLLESNPFRAAGHEAAPEADPLAVRGDDRAPHISQRGSPRVPGKRAPGRMASRRAPHMWNRRYDSAFLDVFHPTSGRSERSAIGHCHEQRGVSTSMGHQKKSDSQPMRRPVTLPKVPVAAGRRHHDAARRPGCDARRARGPPRSSRPGSPPRPPARRCRRGCPGAPACRRSAPRSPACPSRIAPPPVSTTPLLRLRSKPARRISVRTIWQISSARACSTSPSTWRAMMRGLRPPTLGHLDRVLLRDHGGERAAVLLLDLLGLVHRACAGPPPRRS